MNGYNVGYTDAIEDMKGGDLGVEVQTDWKLL